jgi:hypothetical protein
MLQSDYELKKLLENFINISQESFLIKSFYFKQHFLIENIFYQKNGKGSGKSTVEKDKKPGNDSSGICI